MKNKLTILSILALQLCNQILAQQGIRNNGNLQIHNSGSLSIFGEFTNTATAILINNGSVYLKGNVVNDQAAMSPGSGTLHLNGTGDQVISGAESFKTNHLVTNNSSGITLNVNLSVSGTHTFIAGKVATASTPNYLVYESGSTSTGSNDDSHVTGWVKKMGNTDFVFPVGNASYLRTITILNLTAPSEINCHYYSPTQNISSLVSPLTQVKRNEYWQLNKVSGGNAQVNINWDHSRVSMDNILRDDIVAALYNGSNWTDAGGVTTATGDVTTTGAVSSNSLATFGAFTLGYTSFPVPLKTISFTAERKPGASYLKWITDNEQNVGHFDIGRSDDAINFASIGRLAARNRGTLENYTFEDHNPLNGNAWYRLRIMDMDGEFSYSKIVLVSESGSSSRFIVQNPARNAITIVKRSGREGLYHYNLRNMQGQLMMEGRVLLSNNNSTQLQLPPAISPGIYLLLLKNEVIHSLQKIIIENN